jgi:TfoX/Sxy family transcriptional regulator of competence genes
MSTNPDFIAYIVEQIHDAGEITFKKMFGEYMVYSNGKPLLLVCDNTVFVKILDLTTALLPGAEKDFPYSGSKEHYIVNPDDSAQLSHLVRELEKITSLPSPKPKPPTKSKKPTPPRPRPKTAAASRRCQPRGGGFSRRKPAISGRGPAT